MRKENSSNAINKQFLSESCILNAAVDAFSGRWIPQIIYSISEGLNRFHLLKNELPNISEQVLGRKLKELEKEGIIIKEVIPDTVPAGVCYILTEKGKDLLPVFVSICEWGKKYVMGKEMD